MSAPATPISSAPHSIVAYVAVGRKPLDQRERIEAALATVGLRAAEVVEEDVAEATARGRYGIGRVRELATSSSVDLLVVTSDAVLFSTPSIVESFRRDMAAHGVRVLALE